MTLKMSLLLHKTGIANVAAIRCAYTGKQMLAVFLMNSDILYNSCFIYVAGNKRHAPSVLSEIRNELFKFDRDPMRRSGKIHAQEKPSSIRKNCVIPREV